jgi:hypothetical protein
MINGFNLPAWFNKKPSPPDYRPDIQAFLDYARRGRIGEEYTGGQQYSDFLKTFGMDPVGQRVLYQICDWAGMFSINGPCDDSELQRSEGRREVAFLIMAALNADIPDELIGPHPSKEDSTGE